MHGGISRGTPHGRTLVSLSLSQMLFSVYWNFMRVASVLFCLLLLGSGRLGAVLFLTFYAQMHWTGLLLLKKTINSNHVVLVCFFALHFLCMIWLGLFLYIALFFFFFFKKTDALHWYAFTGRWGQWWVMCTCNYLFASYFFIFLNFFYILTVLWFVWEL